MHREAAGKIVEIPFVVEPNYAGWRLDLYLCEKIRRLSRSRIQQIIEKDLICDRPLKSSSRIVSGLAFRLRRRVEEEPDAPKEIGEIFCDEAILVVDKPAGLPIHATARYHHNTLVQVLRTKYGPDFGTDPAHRLDRETSGLVLCARTTEVSRRLGRAFVAGEVEKSYLAICEGSPKEDRFEVDAPIAEGGAQIRIAVRVDPLLGRPSRTEFTVSRRFERDGAVFALLRARPVTGRQHQIRIHLRHAGFPLVGDKIYGPDEGYFDRFSKHCLESEAWARLRLPRHALHAASLAFAHPLTGKRLQLESPLPMDLRTFLED